MGSGRSQGYTDGLTEITQKDGEHRDQAPRSRLAVSVHAALPAEDVVSTYMEEGCPVQDLLLLMEYEREDWTEDCPETVGTVSERCVRDGEEREKILNVTAGDAIGNKVVVYGVVPSHAAAALEQRRDGYMGKNSETYPSMWPRELEEVDVGDCACLLEPHREPIEEGIKRLLRVGSVDFAE